MNAHEALADFARDARRATCRETSIGYRWILDGHASPIAWVEGENIAINRSRFRDVTDSPLAHPTVAGLDKVERRDFILLPGLRSFSRAVFDHGLTEPEAILEATGFGDAEYAAYCKSVGVDFRSKWRIGFDNGRVPAEYLGVTP